LSNTLGLDGGGAKRGGKRWVSDSRRTTSEDLGRSRGSVWSGKDKKMIHPQN